MPSARKSRLQVPGPIPDDCAAEMVEVEMGEYDIGDFFGIDPEFGQPGKQAAPTIDAVERALLVGESIPDSGIDQDRLPAIFGEGAMQAHVDAIALVHRHVALPERLGNDSEHRSPIHSETPIAHQVDTESTDLDHDLLS